MSVRWFKSDCAAQKPKPSRLEYTQTTPANNTAEQKQHKARVKDKQRIHKEWFGFGRDKKVPSLLFVVPTYCTIFGRNNAIPRNMQVPEMSESNKDKHSTKRSTLRGEHQMLKHLSWTFYFRNWPTVLFRDTPVASDLQRTVIVNTRRLNTRCGTLLCFFDFFSSWCSTSLRFPYKICNSNF